MDNQMMQQPKSSAGISKGKITFVLGIIAATIVIGRTVFANVSSGTISDPSAVASQRKFYDKLITAQMEFQQKVNAATKEVEQK